MAQASLEAQRRADFEVSGFLRELQVFEEYVQHDLRHNPNTEWDAETLDRTRILKRDVSAYLRGASV